MSTANYERIRDLIQDGDFVFFKAEALKQRIICWFTGGKHSHCGIANWMTDDLGKRRLMLVESFVGGCRMVTMSSYASRGMDVLSIEDMDWAEQSEYVMSKTGKVHYGTFDFITIGVRDLLIRLGFRNSWILNHLPNGEGEVCSEMLADVIARFKPMQSTLVSPADLYRTIHERKYALRQLTAD